MNNRAPKYPKEFVADVKARTLLGALIGRDVMLKKRGGELLGLCPFHAERTPSFTVVEAKGFWHCFGCGAHGDAIGYLVALKHMTFLEALEDLAAEAGLIARLDAPARPAPVIARPSAEALAL